MVTDGPLIQWKLCQVIDDDSELHENYFEALSYHYLKAWLSRKSGDPGAPRSSVGYRRGGKTQKSRVDGKRKALAIWIHMAIQFGFLQIFHSL